MPEFEFDPRHKTISVFDIDQLRLTNGEKARIAIMDQKAKMQLTHFIRHASFGLGDDKRSKGRYLVCLGDYATVMEHESDPERCPACKMAEPGRDVEVSMPRRRFVIHVARYRTNSNGQVVSPISLALQAWMFGDDKFNKLVDRQAEHGDLRKKDILLTCTAQKYQQFDIDVSAKCMLSADKPAIVQYKELQKDRNADLERLIGQVLTYEALERLVGEATPPIKDEDTAASDKGAIADIMADLDKDEVVIQDADEPFATNGAKSEVKVPAGEVAADDVNFDSLLEP